MKVLKGILSESRDYYAGAKKNIEKRILALPKGSVKKRKIGNKYYYYLQARDGGKVVHKYLGRRRPVGIASKLKERRVLQKELKKIRGSLKMIKKVK